MKSAFLLPFAMLAPLCAGAATLAFDVNLNLAGLSGTPPYGLQVVLTDGLFSSSDLTTVSLSNFVLTGGAFSGSVTTGGVTTGDFSGVTTLSTSGGSDSFLSRDFGAGVTSVAFRATITTNLSASAAPDTFSVFVYDQNEFIPVGSTDSSLISAAIDSTPTFGEVSSFSGAGITTSVTVVPEPAAFGLVGASVLVAVSRVARRRRVA